MRRGRSAANLDGAMRPPYPTGLVPLLPEFLTRRRVGFDWVLRAMERHGVDRPAIILLLNLEYRGAAHGGMPATALRSPYATIHDQWQAALAALEGAGLAILERERWHLTDAGRAVASEGRDAAAAYLARRRTIPDAEVSAIAADLDRAYAAFLAAREPEAREHTDWGRRFRTEPPASALAALENAVYGLWMARDDCHMAAWRAAGMEGPAVDVLTRIWRSEAATLADLAGKLTHQRPEDVTRAVAAMRQAGLVAADDPLALSGRGRALREGIEAETDRLFFSPWPDDIAARAPTLEEGLRSINASLADTS